MATPEVLAEAAPRRPDDTRRMRLVDHREGIMPMADLQKARQVKHVAVHGEHRIGHDEPPPADA